MPQAAVDYEGKENLQFLYDLKHEEALINSEDAQNIHTKGDSIYHGMRRNSSFADYFEGDLSQNLLSRRHFQLLTNEACTSEGQFLASEKQIINAQLPDQIRSRRCANTATSDGKLSEVLRGHWFFTKSTKTTREMLQQRKRTISLPCDYDLEDEDDDEVLKNNSSKRSLKNIAIKHFSAFNVSIPQSL